MQSRKPSRVIELPVSSRPMPVASKTQVEKQDATAVSQMRSCPTAPQTRESDITAWAGCQRGPDPDT